jgi:endogenous inhibitor of DNA gyrase (YacG/DUF329 family)
MGNAQHRRCTQCGKKTAACVDTEHHAFCSATCSKVWEREHPTKPVAQQHEPCHSESMSSG